MAIIPLRHLSKQHKIMVFSITKDSETVGAAEANTLDSSVLCVECVGFVPDEG